MAADTDTTPDQGTTDPQGKADQPKATSRAGRARAAAAQNPAGEQDAPTERTTLDSHIDAPSVTMPGDGPADTTDPLERATSVTPDKAAAALAGHGTVNAAVPLPQRDVIPGVPDKGDDRVEEYDVVGPDGQTVSVRHNLDTGETERS